MSCRCDHGWKGAPCSGLNVAKHAPAKGRTGLLDPAQPTWGGGAVFEAGRWYLIVGARAVASANDSLTDYPCDSNIVGAVSAGADPGGPYTVEQTIVGRSSPGWHATRRRASYSHAIVPEPTAFHDSGGARPDRGKSSRSRR